MKKVESFREILLRKTRDDENLNTLIKYMDREILAEYAIESLEKMAERRVKGGKLNSAAQDFARDIGQGHAHMIHDALSHHATKMKAALTAGNESAAQDHAKSFVKTMNSAQRLSAHSGGKLKIDAADFKPWDQNNFPKHRKGDGKKRTDYTQAKGWHTMKGNNGEALLDSMLRGPHWSYEHSDSRTFNKYKDQAYPIHDVKVNGKYLHIDDTHQYDANEANHSHEFDSHPIHDIIMHSDDKLGADKRQKFLDSHHDFHTGEDGGQKQWISRHRDLMQNDENYNSRGIEAGKGLEEFKRDSHKAEMHDAHPEFGQSAQPAVESKVEEKPEAPKQDLSNIDWDKVPDDIKAMLGDYRKK